MTPRTKKINTQIKAIIVARRGRLGTARLRVSRVLGGEIRRFNRAVRQEIRRELALI